jgi:hypothetical protein
LIRHTGLFFFESTSGARVGNLIYFDTTFRFIPSVSRYLRVEISLSGWRHAMRNQAFCFYDKTLWHCWCFACSSEGTWISANFILGRGTSSPHIATMPKVNMSDGSCVGTSIDHVNRDMKGYRDFSLYLEENENQVERHKKAEANFPAKLHHILSDPQFSHSIVWMVRNKIHEFVSSFSASLRLDYDAPPHCRTTTILITESACCITSPRRLLF